ncbi:MAG: hypothetical protein EXR75_02465 [Myxococcales bacterium]|nr:hypothetical protein [Myxococcales bacterium]
MNAILRRGLQALLGAALVSLATPPAAAHPGGQAHGHPHKPGPHDRPGDARGPGHHGGDKHGPKDGHGHDKHGPEDGHGHGDRDRKPPTKEQLAKRIEHIKERHAERVKNRVQRRQDARRDLRKRLAKHLKGTPAGAAARAELTAHARRTAKLRRARVLAAQHGDHKAVATADTLLARENARHQMWWQKAHEIAKDKKEAGQ